MDARKQEKDPVTHALSKMPSSKNVNRAMPRFSHTYAPAHTLLELLLSVANKQLAPTSRIIDKPPMPNQPFRRVHAIQTAHGRAKEKATICTTEMPCR